MLLEAREIPACDAVYVNAKHKVSALDTLPDFIADPASSIRIRAD